MGRTRHYKKKQYDDWYIPKDFLSHAAGIAKEYCRAHKDAERETVYRAAQDAAFLYECSERYRKKYKFVLFVGVAIRTALYKLERKEDMPKLKEAEIAAFEADVIAGELTYNQLSDKYNISSSNVAMRIKGLKEEGKIPDTNKQGQKPKAKAPAPAEKTPEEKAPAAALTASETVSIPAAAVMPEKLNMIASELMLQEVVGHLHPGAEITETFASNVSGYANTSFIIGGTEYSLRLSRVGG